MLLGLKSLNIYTCPRLEPLNNNDIRSEDQNIRVFDDHFQVQIFCTFCNSFLKYVLVHVK